MSPEDRSSTVASRAPVPEGTISVAIGLFINGISTYVFFKIGQQALGQDGFKPIVTMWFIAFALVPGFFLPLEQETSRALAQAEKVVSKVVATVQARRGVDTTSAK